MKKLLSTLFALAFALNCYAADVKISDLTEVTSPTTSTAVLPVVDAGATKKVTIDNKRMIRQFVKQSVLQWEAEQAYNTTHNTGEKEVDIT